MTKRPTLVLNCCYLYPYYFCAVYGWMKIQWQNRPTISSSQSSNRFWSQSAQQMSWVDGDDNGLREKIGEDYVEDRYPGRLGLRQRRDVDFEECRKALTWMPTAEGSK